MKEIFIVDSNLIFSAALNLNSGIGRFIMKSRERNVILYAPEYLRAEIEKHTAKIIELSKLTPTKVQHILLQIYARILFINDEIIPFEEYVKALRIVRDIDPDDVTFVALNNYLDKTLWTGDDRLYKGLKAKGYEKVVNFNDIKKMFGLE